MTDEVLREAVIDGFGLEERACQDAWVWGWHRGEDRRYRATSSSAKRSTGCGTGSLADGCSRVTAPERLTGGHAGAGMMSFVEEPATEVRGSGGSVPPSRPTALATGGDEGGLILRARERDLLTILCRPLEDGESSPATVDEAAKELGVTPQRIEQILRPLHARFGVLDDGGDESRVARLVTAAMRRGFF
jgi:hypothetical protein